MSLIVYPLIRQNILLANNSKESDIFKTNQRSSTMILNTYYFDVFLIIIRKRLKKLYDNKNNIIPESLTVNKIFQRPHFIGKLFKRQFPTFKWQSIMSPTLFHRIEIIKFHFQLLFQYNSCYPYFF